MVSSELCQQLQLVPQCSGLAAGLHTQGCWERESLVWRKLNKVGASLHCAQFCKWSWSEWKEWCETMETTLRPTARKWSEFAEDILDCDRALFWFPYQAFPSLFRQLPWKSWETALFNSSHLSSLSFKIHEFVGHLHPALVLLFLMEQEFRALPFGPFL